MKNTVLLLLVMTLFPWAAQAGTAASERAAVMASVRLEVSRDLGAPYTPAAGVQGRTCLDGRPVDGFPGEVLEYWVNLECVYCSVREPLHAQRLNPDICVVARHAPAPLYSESLKKALSYEALKTFSSNAANTFWEAVTPKTALAVPAPYAAALVQAVESAAVSADAFSAALSGEAAATVDGDMQAAQGRITSTPTYVLAGVRFPACDFTAAQLPLALELARKARAGDKESAEKIVEIITSGLLGEKLL